MQLLAIRGFHHRVAAVRQYRAFILPIFHSWNCFAHPSVLTDLISSERAGHRKHLICTSSPITRPKWDWEGQNSGSSYFLYSNSLYVAPLTKNKRGQVSTPTRMCSTYSVYLKHGNITPCAVLHIICMLKA